METQARIEPGFEICDVPQVPVIPTEELEEDGKLEADSYESTLQRQFFRSKFDDEVMVKLLEEMEGMNEKEIQEGHWYRFWDF